MIRISVSVPALDPKTRQPSRLSPIRSLFRFFIFSSIVLIASCQQGTKKEAAVAESADTAKDSTSGKSVIKYAHSFTIDYFDHYKLVQVLNTLTGKSDTLQYLLVQRGTPIPSGYPKAQVINIPVKTIIGMSSMHIALTDFAGVSEACSMSPLPMSAAISRPGK
jgi:iron complex transport system substrate-binding protein